ncbi:S8 family peptidase [Candidatus Chlorohelix sp.]|uniref:S8 family peptidase n=1 Tax=Candidatus Chlorohelix sp. TaxID=3139201 RepID=UPI003027FA72
MIKKLSLSWVVIMMLSIFTTLFPTASYAELPNLSVPVQKIVDRTDALVASGAVKRSWTWGNYFETKSEPYKESPGGARQVFYFDKGRLEINNPATDPNNDFYATSGLLVRELITGQTQLGDSDLQAREPADVVLAGDNPPLIADSPTYASLKELVSFDGSWKSNDMTGKVAGATLKKGGQVDNSLAPFSQVKYVQYDNATGHNIADVFQKFMDSSGQVVVNGKTVTAPLYNPLYVFGHPISEAYWVKVTVAGKEQSVLIQAFERRLLTYTPNNPPEFQVEMGNLGRAYFQWRYSAAQPVPAADPLPEAPQDTPGLQLYNQYTRSMNSVRSLRLERRVNNQLTQVDEFVKPNKQRTTIYGTYQGQPAYELDIQIESRIYFNLFVNNKQLGTWQYVDLIAPLRWPNYPQLSLNDNSFDFKIGQDTKVGNEASKTLINTGIQLDGSQQERTRLISAVTGVLLQRNTVSKLGNATSTEALSYLNYNQPIAIDPPQGAIPYTGLSVSSPLARNQFVPSSIGADDTTSLYQKVSLYTRPLAAPGEVVVKFKEPQISVQAIQSDFMSGYALSDVAQGDIWTTIKLDPAAVPGALERLNADPRVIYAEPAYYYYTDAVVAPNDAGYNQQYNLKAIKVPRAWSISTGGDVTVAVLDSGVDTIHPDLAPNIAGTFDFVDGSSPKADPNGHGTVVSGIITATGNNGQFGAGVAWKSKLLAVRVMGANGSGRNEDIAKGIRSAADNGARIINMSLGGSTDSKVLREAVQYAIDKGVIVIASSGNSGNDNPNYPAAYPGVISVAAVGKLGTPAYFSSYGSAITITAPGVGICSTIRLNNFGCEDGTSFSAPIIAGVVTLMLAVNPTLTRDQVKAILIATAVPAPGRGVGEFDYQYGYGTVNAYAAVRAVATNQFFNLPPGIRS